MIPDFESRFGRAALQRLKREYFIWLITVGTNGAPQPRPVWFVWDGDSFVIYSQPTAHKLKHIQKNPQVTLHFNTQDELGENGVFIFSGEAKVDENCPPAHGNRAYMKKYKEGIARLGATPEQFSGEYSVALRVKPAKLRGSE